MQSFARIAALLLALSGGAMAQDAPPASGARAPIRTLMGELALVLRDQGDGTLALGVAGSARNVLLTVRASDARRWADSVSRLAAAPRAASPVTRRGGRGLRGHAGAATPGRGEPNDTSPAVRVRVVLEEPGVGAGTLQLTRLDSAGTRTWSLFADDADLVPLRATLEPGDAATLARLVRRATAPTAARRAAPGRSVKPGRSATSAKPRTPGTPGTPPTARRAPSAASSRRSR